MIKGGYDGAFRYFIFLRTPLPYFCTSKQVLVQKEGVLVSAPAYAVLDVTYLPYTWSKFC